MINGFVDLTTAGWVHTVLASVGILVGAEQLIRTRRAAPIAATVGASVVVGVVGAVLIQRFRPNPVRTTAGVK